MSDESGPDTDTKLKFKTNAVNQLFQPSPPSEPRAASPTLQTKQTVTKLTLSNKKPDLKEAKEENADTAVVNDDAGESREGPKPVVEVASSEVLEAKERRAESADESPEAPKDAGKVDGKADEKAEPKNGPAKHEYTEEELSHKGISIAGRFQSASNENWEEEEEEWLTQEKLKKMPMPSYATSHTLSNNLRAFRREPAKPGAAASETSHEESKWRRTNQLVATTSDSHRLTISGKSSTPPTDSSHGASAEESAWGAPKNVSKSKTSFADRIREAKNQAPPKLGQRGDPDAYNRFRIPTSATVAGGGSFGGLGGGFRRGAPPLNPRRIMEEDDEPMTFQMGGDLPRRSGPPMDFSRRVHAPPPVSEDHYDFSRRIGPSDGSAAGSGRSQRPIPSRFLKPSAGGTAGLEKPNPFGRARPAEGPSSTSSTLSKVPESGSNGAANGAAEAASEVSEAKVSEAKMSEAPVSEVPALAPAAAPTPARAAEPELTPQIVKEVQEKDMTNSLALARARAEARAREEEEKRKKREALLEQYRKEKHEQDMARRKQEEQERLEKKNRAIAERTAREAERKELERKRLEVMEKRRTAERLERERLDKERAANEGSSEERDQKARDETRDAVSERGDIQQMKRNLPLGPSGKREPKRFDGKPDAKTKLDARKLDARTRLDAKKLDARKADARTKLDAKTKFDPKFKQVRNGESGKDPKIHLPVGLKFRGGFNVADLKNSMRAPPPTRQPVATKIRVKLPGAEKELRLQGRLK